MYFSSSPCKRRSYCSQPICISTASKRIPRKHTQPRFVHMQISTFVTMNGSNKGDGWEKGKNNLRRCELHPQTWLIPHLLKRYAA